jgi:hypothetical protein
MTDRSTDNPEDQPDPLDPDATPAADSGAAEQEAIAEVAGARGVDPPPERLEPAELAEPDDAGSEDAESAEPPEPNELAEAAEPNELTEEAGGEAASDLDAEELEAAATAAEEDPRADTQIVEVEVESPAAPSGPATRGAPKATAAVRAGGRTAIVVDPALRIRDRASAVFVALTVIVFVAIFANAMLFGVGGALNPPPLATPSASPGSSGSPAPSGSAGPSGSTAPTTTAPATTAAPSAS